MLVRKLAAILFALAIFTAAAAASAQDAAAPQKEKTIADRIDNLGKSIFGGFMPEEKAKTKDADLPQKPSRAARKSSPTEPPDTKNAAQTNAQRAGSILTPPAAAGHVPSSDKTAGDVSEMTPENTPPAISHPGSQPAKMFERPLAGISMPGQSEMPEEPKAQAPADPPQNAANDQSASRPLHERLSTIRQSVFGSDGVQDSNAQPSRPQGRAAETPAAKPSVSGLGAPRPSTRPIIAQRTKPELDESPAAEPILDPAANINNKPEKGIAGSQPTPTIFGSGPAATENEKTPLRVDNMPPAIEKRPVAISKMPPAIERRPVAIDNVPRAIERRPAAVEKMPAVVEAAPVTAMPESDDGLLVTRKGPVLNIETLGPRRISVGKESSYEVGIVNSGEVAAEDLLVFVSLPEWADVVGADVSSGTAQATVTAQSAGAVQWKLGHLDAKGRERMTLKIIPRQSRPFDLAVRRECRPTSSQAMIEVQEAKLALQLEGPREVLYGKKETYRLRVANVGNGGAENVAIMLMPIGGGENVPATHKIGRLSAGEEKSLDVELTARQAGNLTIQLDARAEDGVHAELAEKVLVRRAGLKIDVDGPKMQFMGVAANYAVRVRNPGTAPARNVKLSVMLPAGAKYLTGVEDAQVDASGSKVQWTIESIGPDVEQSFVVKCNLGAVGANRVQVNAAAEDDLTASANAVTRIESVANLTMEVVDPEGPVAVSDEATYEVHVRNRGSKEATAIEVFAYFSRGIEPVGAEGGPNRLSPGQVTFQPIPVLAAGAEAVFKVHAKAQAPGNHIFRAEAHCRPLGTRLIREATNLFYTEGASSQQTARESSNDGALRDAMRPVTRPIQADRGPMPPRQ